LVTQEKAPLTRGKIDKDINSQNDYITQSGEALASSDVIDYFQRYKGALQVLVGKQVHLTLKDKKIEWSECHAPIHKERKRDKRVMKKEIKMIRKKIDFDPLQIESVEKQYGAGVLCAVVEEWLSFLSEREGMIAFYTWINHDWEKGLKGLYKGLSEREIGVKLGIEKSTVMRCKKRIIQKILEKN